MKGIYSEVCRMTFLGKFAKLRKVTIGFIVSDVRLSAWNNSTPTGRIFMKVDMWIFFENMSKNEIFIKI